MHTIPVTQISGPREIPEQLLGQNGHLPSSWDFEFYTLERSVVVEQGKVTYCELQPTDRLPSGWARSKREINYKWVSSWSDIISGGTTVADMKK